MTTPYETAADNHRDAIARLDSATRDYLRDLYLGSTTEVSFPAYEAAAARVEETRAALGRAYDAEVRSLNPPTPEVQWTRRVTGPKSYDQERDGVMGPPKNRARNSVLVRTSHFHGTLGPDGGWEQYETPYASLTISLPSGRDDLRDKLTEELKEFANRFLANNGLDPK